MKEGSSVWEEFKAFILRGNVIELAVGLVMGSAFTAIVNALVNNIIMPFIAGLTSNVSVEAMSFTFNNNEIQYGMFLQAIINFLIIAIVLFFAIKALNTMAERFQREEEAEADEEPIPSAEDYLKEIRDLLAEEQSKDDSKIE